MATLIKKPNWSDLVKGLKRRVAAGDIAAMRDLGLTLVGLQRPRRFATRSPMVAARHENGRW